MTYTHDIKRIVELYTHNKDYVNHVFNNFKRTEYCLLAQLFEKEDEDIYQNSIVYLSLFYTDIEKIKSTVYIACAISTSPIEYSTRIFGLLDDNNETDIHAFGFYSGYNVLFDVL